MANSHDPELTRRMVDQLEGRAKRHYSAGRISADDDGDLVFALGADRRRRIVILDFGTRVSWLGLPPEQAAELGRELIKMAQLVKGR